MPYNPEDPSAWPEHVRKAPRKKGRRWAHVWNSVMAQTGEESRAFAAANASLKKSGDALTFSDGLSTLAKGQENCMDEPTAVLNEPDLHIGVPFEKVDRANRLVYGYVTGEEIDKQGDVVGYEGSLEALTNWAGNMRYMHDPHRAVGRRVRILPYADQRRIGLIARVSRSHDGDNCWQQIEDGTLTGFSINGPPRATAPPPKGARRFVTKWDCNEVSFVDNPAYRPSKLQVMLAKRADDGTVLASEVLSEPRAWTILAKGNVAVFASADQEDHADFLKAQGFGEVGSVSVFDAGPGVKLEDAACPRCGEAALEAELSKAAQFLSCAACRTRFAPEPKKDIPTQVVRRSLPGLLIEIGKHHPELFQKAR